MSLKFNMKVFRWSFFQVVMPGSGRIFLEDSGLECYFSYVGVGPDISRGFRPRILILVMSGSGRIFLEDFGLEYLF